MKKSAFILSMIVTVALLGGCGTKSADAPQAGDGAAETAVVQEKETGAEATAEPSRREGEKVCVSWVNLSAFLRTGSK